MLFAQETFWLGMNGRKVFTFFSLILIRFVEIYDHLLYVQQTEVVMRVPSNSFIVKCHLAKEGSEFEPGFYIDFRLLTLD